MDVFWIWGGILGGLVVFWGFDAVFRRPDADAVQSQMAALSHRDAHAAAGRGPCSLGERGSSPIEILRYFYGDNMYVNTAEQISGIPASWPGYELTVGSRGDKVRQLQEQLDAIAAVYSAIPRVTPDGIYGPGTEEAVRAFQNIFGLPQTGAVDFATWYKISHIYVGVTRIAELV